MKVYRRLLPYVKVYWARIVAAMGLALVISGLEAMTAWLVKPVLDDVFLKKDLFMLQDPPHRLDRGVRGQGQRALWSGLPYGSGRPAGGDAFARGSVRALAGHVAEFFQ